MSGRRASSEGEGARTGLYMKSGTSELDGVYDFICSRPRGKKESFGETSAFLLGIRNYTKGEGIV